MTPEDYYNSVFKITTLKDLKKKGRDHYQEKERLCPDCKIERIHVGYTTVCPECGQVVDKLESFTPGYCKEPVQYKRLTYFKDILIKVQGKTMMGDLPKEMIPKLQLEVLKNFCVWNILTLKKVLKKLGYSKYYPDAVYIFGLLFPLKPKFKLSETNEKFLISSFLLIQSNWGKVKPKNKKTMFSNPYILKKLSHLGDIPFIFDCFSYPKDIKKLVEYDQIWFKLCNLFDWVYSSSF